MVLYLITCGAFTHNMCSNETINKEAKKHIYKLKENSKNIKDSIIYTSDSLIAKESCALFCCDKFVKEKVYHIEPILRDINFGKWQGQTWDFVYTNYTEDLAKFSTDWVNNKPTSGECFLDVYKRVTPFLSMIKADVRNKEDILVFSHPSSIRAILCKVLELDLKNAYSICIDYGSVFALEYDSCKEQYILLYCNVPAIY